MAFSHEVLHVSTSAPLWQRILSAAVNWLDWPSFRLIVDSELNDRNVGTSLSFGAP